jgi:hypothetical protein
MQAPDTSASKKGVMEILENDDSFDHHNSPDVSADHIRDPSNFNIEEEEN